MPNLVNYYQAQTFTGPNPNKGPLSYKTLSVWISPATSFSSSNPSFARTPHFLLLLLWFLGLGFPILSQGVITNGVEESLQRD